MQLKQKTAFSFWDLCTRCPNAMQQIFDAISRLSDAFKQCVYVPDEEISILIPESLNRGDAEARIALQIPTRYAYPHSSERLYKRQMAMLEVQWRIFLATDRAQAGLYSKLKRTFEECTTEEMILRVIGLWEEGQSDPGPRVMVFA